MDLFHTYFTQTAEIAAHRNSSTASSSIIKNPKKESQKNNCQCVTCCCCARQAGFFLMMTSLKLNVLCWGKSELCSVRTTPCLAQGHTEAASFSVTAWRHRQHLEQSAPRYSPEWNRCDAVELLFLARCVRGLAVEPSLSGYPHAVLYL